MLEGFSTGLIYYLKLDICYKQICAIVLLETSKYQNIKDKITIE